MKKNRTEGYGIVLNVKNLHIHLDEHTEMKSEYTYPDSDKQGCRCDNDGCVFAGGDCDGDGFSAEDEEGLFQGFSIEDVFKDVSDETGFSVGGVKDVVEVYARALRKHLLHTPETNGKAGAK